MKSQSVTAPSLTKKHYTFFTDIRRNRFSYLLILPALLYVLVFSYLSYPYMIIAFKHFNYKLGVFGSEWCGFKNFEFFLKSTNAPTVIRNTLVLNLLFIVTGTLTSLVLAILLNELRSRVFVRTAQTMMLFPHYISWVVVSYILLAIFSNKNGLANQLLNALGMKSVSWYTKADAWPTILVWMKMWKSAGMNAVIYLAAITGIDESIYESATIDGANRFQRIVSITVPLIMPTVCIMTLLAVGKIMNGDFGMIYALVGDQGILYETTDVIDTYVYRVLRQTGDPSQSMAIGLFQSLIGLVMVVGSNWIVKHTFHEGALF